MREYLAPIYLKNRVTNGFLTHTLFLQIQKQVILT